MQAVLISIQPKWCELIASGKKTVEVRKSRPGLNLPFKCYIYETKGRTETPWIDEEGHTIFKGRGAVIGEFVCDAIGTYWFNPSGTDIEECEDVQLACLTAKEILAYANNKELHFWNISDLKIYDKPKPLGDFNMACDKEKETDCTICAELGLLRCKPAISPPQSWYYVEG